MPIDSLSLHRHLHVQPRDMNNLLQITSGHALMHFQNILLWSSKLNHKLCVTELMLKAILGIA